VTPPAVFWHDLIPDETGQHEILLANPDLSDGIGLVVRFPADSLPYFKEWRSLRPGEYVVGVEPANCWGTTRAAERERGTLITLSPGESREHQVTIAAVDGRDEIQAVVNRLQDQRSGIGTVPIEM